MQTPNSFRRIINLLENINSSVTENGKGRQIGRTASGNRTDWVTGQHISSDPIPYSDKADDSESGDEWMKATGISDVENPQKIYVDSENNKGLMIGGYSPSQNAYVYFADNTSKTIGKLLAKHLESVLKSKGMKDDDFKIDYLNGLLKISPRWGTKLPLIFKKR